MLEIKNKNKNELKEMLKEKEIALRNFRFSISGGKTRNVKEGKALIKDVARILTALNSKE